MILSFQTNEKDSKSILNAAWNKRGSKGGPTVWVGENVVPVVASESWKVSSRKYFEIIMTRQFILFLWFRFGKSFLQNCSKFKHLGAIPTPVQLFRPGYFRLNALCAVKCTKGIKGLYASATRAGSTEQVFVPVRLVRRSYKKRTVCTIRTVHTVRCSRCSTCSPY